MVWLVITQWIESPSKNRSAIWFGFLIKYFEDILREVVVSLSLADVGRRVLTEYSVADKVNCLIMILERFWNDLERFGNVSMNPHQKTLLRTLECPFSIFMDIITGIRTMHILPTHFYILFERKKT